MRRLRALLYRARNEGHVTYGHVTLLYKVYAACAVCTVRVPSRARFVGTLTLTGLGLLIVWDKD